MAKKDKKIHDQVEAIKSEQGESMQDIFDMKGKPMYTKDKEPEERGAMALWGSANKQKK